MTGEALYEDLFAIAEGTDVTSFQGFISRLINVLDLQPQLKEGATAFNTSWVIQMWAGIHYAQASFSPYYLISQADTSNGQIYMAFIAGHMPYMHVIAVTSLRKWNAQAVSNTQYLRGENFHQDLSKSTSIRPTVSSINEPQEFYEPWRLNC